MKRMGLALLFSLLIGAASAQLAGGLMFPGPGMPAGASFDPATTAWVAQVVTNGGSVSAGRKTVVDTFIKCLKTNSLFTTMDRYWLLAGENAGSAQTDMISLTTWTFTGTGTFATGFTANQGYAGNGTDNYLDSGVTPSAGGLNYTLNSASEYAYVLTNRTTQTDESVVGDDQGGIEPFKTGAGSYQGQINGISPIAAANPNSTARGSYILARSASNANAIYDNGGSVTTSAGAASALSTTSWLISAQRSFGSPALFSNDQIASAGFGGGWNSTQAGNFETCQNNMMTSIGINVH